MSSEALPDSEVDVLIDAAHLAFLEWWESDQDEQKNMAPMGAIFTLAHGDRRSGRRADLPAADRVVDVGIELLTSSTPADRAFGVHLIREMHRETEVARAILDLLRREADPDVVPACVAGLHFRGCAEAIPDLAKLVDHPDEDLRYLVGGAISTCAVPNMSDEALSALLKLAADEDADARFSALYELSSWWQNDMLRDPRAERMLKAGIDDPDEGVRRTCAEAFEAQQP